MNHDEKVTKLQSLLTEAGVRHFRAYEFFTKGGSNSNPNSRAYQKNTDPPDAFLANIIPTALVIDQARRGIGSPIVISSCFRSAAYNRAVGGAPSSLHLAFKATDLVCHDIPLLYRTLKKMRAAGVFMGGLGGYSSFVHVDTRGYNATWGIVY